MEPISAGILAGASLASSGIGILGASASSKKQYKYQSALQAQAAKLNYDYSLKSAKNMPSATREGLEAGGYNPMLAVQNSTSGANSSWTSAGQSTAPDYNAGLTQGIANAQSFQRLENETNMAETQSQKNSAETSEIIEGLPYVGEQAKANIQKTQAETAQFEATIENMKARLELDRQLGFMGLNVQKYGYDSSYNATKYASDKAYEAAIKGLPPKWATSAGALIGTGAGLYMMTRGKGYSGSKNGFGFK